VDLGTKRIGLAVGETEHAIATPRPALAATGTLKRDAENVSLRAKSEEADLVVIGLPVDLNGEEGNMARIMRRFGALLAELGHEVSFVDETLTSVAATATLARADLTIAESRKRKDGEAACLILERFFREGAMS
jgi:putative Holliday junction resolvase